MLHLNGLIATMGRGGVAGTGPGFPGTRAWLIGLGVVLVLALFAWWASRSPRRRDGARARD